MIGRDLITSEFEINFVLANSVDADEMSHDATFHLGLHCLPKYPFRGFCIQRIKGHNNYPCDTSSW